MGRSLILYELNEVPWPILDQYVSNQPNSSIAHILRTGRSYTSVNRDPSPLSPWRTWPTLHKSMYTADHNSYDLGQDPSTFRGVNIWDAAEQAGLSVGLFGALQSWPPRKFKHGGFYVPDTFAQDAEAVPEGLRSFQAFNLRMTADNSFSPDAPLTYRTVARTGAGLLRRGFTPRSATVVGKHLLRELRDQRYKAGRPMMQVLPSFDLYWRLHKVNSPKLSIFFTNHVAAMMHRYWGDGDPHYAEKYAYCPDPIYRDFVMNAMALADGQIGQLVRYTGHHRDTVLVVAASMGQAPIPYHENTDAFLVLEDGKRLAAALGFPSGRERLTMHPMCSIEFANPAEAESAADVLAQVTDQAGRSVFQAIEARGRSVTFNTHYEPIRNADLQVLNIPKVGRNPTEMRTVSFGDAGLAARARVGGGNTAYHIPEGIVLSYVNGGVADSSREEVDILDMSPSLLSTVLDAPVPLEMRGNVRCDLFA